MTWKQQLRILEKNKQWDDAIQLLQDIIAKNPSNLDAYLSINYLIMNLLVEEHSYDKNKYEYYADLLKEYFDESYVKFSQNPEYLYFIARIAVISEWYFGIEPEDIEIMLQKAIQLDPTNLLYQWTYHSNLDKKDPQNKTLRLEYAKSVFNNESIKKFLLSKGSLGEYILEILTNWARHIIENNPYYS